ncbi:hypothetical protein GUJ93_ZPchr0010g9535 [Zizania palustris]|uniref:Uncharacterized protein n=1 Tax=Zizania palustris TaxID=103762 RepID=A0A8J5W949_ZIZPA|nr:hypothetical protein GUJ93_ZPchr0010g9535 [Zizania palustris]
MAKTLLPSAMLFLPLVLILISAICNPLPAAHADCTPPPCRGKQTWPELLGKDQNAAYNAVKRDNPQVTDVVFLISDGADDGGELCCNRVVLVIGRLPGGGGGEGITKVPRVG